eukprot:6193612-Pleurochrysis_carterae.AAC.1
MDGTLADISKAKNKDECDDMDAWLAKNASHRMVKERSRRENAHAEAVRCTWIQACWLGGLLLIKNGRRKGREKNRRRGKEGPDKKESRKNKGETKSEARVRNANRQRKLVQQRIRIWSKAHKLKYDGKDRKKYRHKARASKRWLWSKHKSDTEAKEANRREHRKRMKKARDRDMDMRRKGGAGGRGRARTVNASRIKEEILKDAGVPQQTWGDGSCWLWAVAGALHKLEGRE